MVAYEPDCPGPTVGRRRGVPQQIRQEEHADCEQHSDEYLFRSLFHLPTPNRDGGKLRVLLRGRTCDSLG